MLETGDTRESELQQLLRDERDRCNEHKLIYQTLKEKHSRLQNDLGSIYDELKVATDQNERQKSESELKVRKLESTVKDLQNEIKSLVGQLKAFDAKKVRISALEEATAHYEPKIKELQLETDKIREQYNNLHYENAILKCKLESRESEFSRTLERINLQHNSEIDQLKNKIEAFEKDQSTPPESFAVELASSKREVIQLNSKIKALLSEIEELRAQNKNLSLQMSSLSLTNSKQVADHLNNIRTLETEKLKTTNQKEIFEKELLNVQAQKKVLNNELLASHRKVATLRNQLEESERQHQITSTNLQLEFDRYKTAKETEQEHFIDELARLKTELSSLNSSFSQERQEMAAKEYELQQNLTTLRQQIWKQTRETNLEREKLERKIKEMEADNENLLAGLKQELESTKHQLHAYASSKIELEKEILALRNQLGEAAKQHGQTGAGFPRENSSFSREIQELRDKIERLTTQRFPDSRQNSPDHEIIQLKLNWEQQKFQFQQRLDELESQLRECRNNFSAEKRELEFKIKQYNKKIGKLKDKLEVQNTQMEELEQQKNSLAENVPLDVHLQVKNQLVKLQKQLEEFRRLVSGDPGSFDKNLAFHPERLLTDIKNIHFRQINTQSTSEPNLVAQVGRSQVKPLLRKLSHPRRKATKLPEKKRDWTDSSLVNSSTDQDLENL